KKVFFHARFKKRYKNLRKNECKRCDQRITLFLSDLQNTVLEDHALAGKLRGYRSINIGGDLRAQYEIIGTDIVHFVRLGTHSELYE
ncbi:MAG: type II toxin-antitoxin system RelE/ParE family toxin, partial [Candidatus Pacebacteria bacterium]|nr:type II toxin-antitoxin system RelE/ParE family toxin [Candidatus Paceibacterota bacterium]